MKKSLLLFSTGVLASVLSLGAYAGKDGEHCDYHKKGGHMAKMDTNDDGMVSRDEFVAVAGTHFDQLDTNGDGVIDKEEFKQKHMMHKHKMKEKSEM